MTLLCYFHEKLITLNRRCTVTGAIDMTNAHKRDQDARFDSTISWTWWPLIEEDRASGEASLNQRGMAECVDGSTGLVRVYGGDASETCSRPTVSMVSTVELGRIFAQVTDPASAGKVETTKTLKQLRNLKRNVSPEYETAKDDLLSKHRVFRQWKRREYDD